MTFTQLNARLKNFLNGWLLALGLKECLVEYATWGVKSEVMLTYTAKTTTTTTTYTTTTTTTTYTTTTTTTTTTYTTTTYTTTTGLYQVSETIKKLGRPDRFWHYRHSSMSAIFDLTRFKILSYFLPL